MPDSKKYGVYFNGRHSSEFGIIALEDKKVGFPSKKKITVSVPFSNTVYDFSGVYGGQTYEERFYKQVFCLMDRQKWDTESLYRLWTKVVNWLMEPSTKTPLYDDVMKKYYYLAEVVKEPSLKEIVARGELTIEWTCYPFRIYEDAEGHDIFDIFDFEMDIAQTTSFDINGTRAVALFNEGMSISNPTIKTSSTMIISKNNVTFNIPKGTSTSSRFRLTPGINYFTITGQGTIEFSWHKELI